METYLLLQQSLNNYEPILFIHKCSRQKRFHPGFQGRDALASREGMPWLPGKGCPGFQGRDALASREGMPWLPGKGCPGFQGRDALASREGMPWLPGKGGTRDSMMKTLFPK